MKHLLILMLFSHAIAARAQKIDSIYVNLYTDSLKKGTFNYINIDGLLSNGRYLPLDSTQLIFSASSGRFSGNCLWLDRDFREDKVNIKVVLRKNPTIFKTFDMYIKKNPDNEKLKTADEIINEMQQNPKKKKRGN